MVLGLVRGRYGAGIILPDSINGRFDTYGPMLDWSDRDRLAFSGRRDEAGDVLSCLRRGTSWVYF